MTSSTAHFAHGFTKRPEYYAMLVECYKHNTLSSVFFTSFDEPARCEACGWLEED